MKTILLCLTLLICLKLHGATVDDEARAFLVNAVGVNAVVPLTNTTILTERMIATNSTANSNLTFVVGQNVNVYLTNNASATNWPMTPITNGVYSVVFLPQMVNRTLVAPSLGADSFGLHWNTNMDGSVSYWPTMTAGVKYAWVVIQRGSNMFSRMTAWK